jgi:hypothetical protein
LFPTPTAWRRCVRGRGEPREKTSTAGTEGTMDPRVMIDFRGSYSSANPLPSEYPKKRQVTKGPG